MLRGGLTGSAYNAMDVFEVCESLLKGRGLGKGGQSDLHWIGGWRMTGSAYQAMDVIGICDSLYRVGVWGRDSTAIPPETRLADDGKRL